MANENTVARRARVRSLWLKSDAQIAEILLEEGFGGPIKRTTDGRRKQIDTMRRNVWNDREALKKEWRAAKRATSEDAHESRGQHLAVLDSLQDMGVEMLSDPKLKGTPRAQALQALTRIVEAKGKALGVGEVAPADPESEDDATPGVVGLILSTKNLSPEMRDELRAQGYVIDDEDDGDGSPASAAQTSKRRV